MPSVCFAPSKARARHLISQTAFSSSCAHLKTTYWLQSFPSQLPRSDARRKEALYTQKSSSDSLAIGWATLSCLRSIRSFPSLTNANAGSVTSEQSIDSRTAPSVHESPSASLCGLSQTAMEAASYLLTILQQPEMSSTPEGDRESPSRDSCETCSCKQPTHAKRKFPIPCTRFDSCSRCSRNSKCRSSQHCHLIIRCIKPPLGHW